MTLLVKDVRPSNIPLRNIKDVVLSNKLYYSHNLYYKHQLYYGNRAANDNSPLTELVEDTKPEMLSVNNL